MINFPAAAKINLALHVTARQDNGYHRLDTLVIFTEFGDLVRVEPADQLSLSIGGQFSGALGCGDDNLVIVAARMLQQILYEKGCQPSGAAIHLEKNLPIASGIGGGSADAAATLIALCELWKIDKDTIPLPDIALKLGADVPMCLYSRSLRAKGIGDEIEEVQLPQLNLVLVNPGIQISTPEIFHALTQTKSAPLPRLDFGHSETKFLHWFERTKNDLQQPAIGIVPDIQTVLNELLASDNCSFARMSGSGATCFGLFESIEQAKSVANDIGQRNPDWWCIASKTITPSL